MSSATAMIAALVLGTVLNRPGPTPGADAVIEEKTATIQISGTDTNGSNSFSLDAEYASNSDVRPSIGLELDSQSGSAADPGQITHRITAAETGKVDVRVDLGTAPGSGESTTIRVHLTVVGVQG